MKTLIASITTAALLGLACYLTNSHTDAAGLTAVAFVSGLVGWTVSLYGREKSLEAPKNVVAFAAPRPAIAVAHRIAA